MQKAERFYVGCELSICEKQPAMRRQFGDDGEFRDEGNEDFRVQERFVEMGSGADERG